MRTRQLLGIINLLAIVNYAVWEYAVYYWQLDEHVFFRFDRLIFWPGLIFITVLWWRSKKANE